MDLGQEHSYCSVKPILLSFWGEKKLSLPLQLVGLEVSFPWSVSAGQDMEPGSPLAPPALDGEHRPGMDPSCPAAVPFPMCHPSLAAWELKISEMQGITGCLNISCL